MNNKIEKMRIIRKFFGGLFLCSAMTFRLIAQDVRDQVIFGNEASERSHQLVGEASKASTGAFKEPVRFLLPAAGESWKGGNITFSVKVDPLIQNYFTIRLWGSDINENHLILLCEGKQVGYRHLGDINLLDLGAEAPLYNNHFIYTTTPLPFNLTKGKNEIKLTIQSNGRIWGYASTFEKYQYAMREPSRGIYVGYVHTDGCFTPSATEKQGLTMPNLPVRKGTGDSRFKELKERVNKAIDGLLKGNRPLNQVQMQFLAKAYTVKWTYAYRDERVIDRVQESLDHTYDSYLNNPKLAESEPSTPNPEWFGLGISGQVIDLLFNELKKEIDKPLNGTMGVKIGRREAYIEMLTACREYHRKNRRQYTNQSMINDLYGIYYANKGIADLNPTKALPENNARKYLYESMGLEQWTGSETDHGPSFSAGKNYWQLTDQGLTKELGYVGYYGEVIDWASEIYEATRPAADKPGDEGLKKQLEKIALARAYFRYPAMDSSGYRSMRIETTVGWRDTHFPGDVTYAQRPSRDGSALQVAAATLNPELVGYVQQMMNDNQFFQTLEVQMSDKAFRSTAGLLPIPDQYDLLQKQVLVHKDLPMGWNQPDLVFADVEDGVLAIKNGNEIFYASLYWRARTAVNFLAKVHHITPQYDRSAVVHVDEEFEPSGMFYTRPDWTNFGFGNGGIKYPEDVHSAIAGEKLPIAKIPDGVPFKAGQENPYAGRALFYKLKYGKYLIGMNASKDKSFEMPVPETFSDSKDLVSRKSVGRAKTVLIKPLSTVVLFNTSSAGQ